MGEIIDINALSPHMVSEVICLKCYTRWISVRLIGTRLRDLECPKCHRRGYAIETGEIIEELEDD